MDVAHTHILVSSRAAKRCPLNYFRFSFICPFSPNFVPNLVKFSSYYPVFFSFFSIFSFFSFFRGGVFIFRVCIFIFRVGVFTLSLLLLLRSGSTISYETFKHTHPCGSPSASHMHCGAWGTGSKTTSTQRLEDSQWHANLCAVTKRLSHVTVA